MRNIQIDPTDREPGIDFDFQNNVFTIYGESYPEDAPAFYGPIVNALSDHLGGLSGGAVEFNFEFIYFNSTSAKVVMKLLDALEEAGENGVKVTINWRYDPEDENMEELGEDFGEDVEAATFNLVAKER